MNFGRNVLTKCVLFQIKAFEVRSVAFQAASTVRLFEGFDLEEILTAVWRREIGVSKGT